MVLPPSPGSATIRSDDEAGRAEARGEDDEGAGLSGGPVGLLLIFRQPVLHQTAAQLGTSRSSQNYRRWEDQVLIVHFVLRAVQTDTISYFQMDAEELMKELAEFGR